MHSIESADPKLLAAMAKTETDEKLKSGFEAMVACVLPHAPVANNKPY